jgi:hypothetical protein
MPTANYEFQYYSTSLAAWVDLNDMLDYDVKIGRDFQLDTYRADTCRVTFWLTSGVSFAGPQYTVKPGMPIRIIDKTRKVILFSGITRDTQVDYGMPYNSVTDVGNADRFTVYGEGALAVFGRMSGDGYVMAADTLNDQIDTAETESGGTIIAPYDAASISMGGTTVSGTWGDWVTRVVLTLNDRIRQLEDEIEIVSKYDLEPLSMSFATVDGPLFQRYDRIEYESLADNYYTQVIVQPEGLGEAVAELGSKPFRTYTVNTVNASVAQAEDYADYLLANYSSLAAGLSMIGARSSNQGTNFYLDNMGEADGVTDFYTQSLVGYYTQVAFRTLTTDVVIEGLTISGNPDEQRFTFQFSQRDLNSYLILDDGTFGTLDNNKLGY